MSELQTEDQPPSGGSGQGDEAFLVGAFAVGVHFLAGFFIAASIFLLAMPMEPPVVRKVMLGFSIVFSVACSVLGTMVSPTRRPARNLGFTLLASALASLAFLTAVKFTIDDPRLAQMAADTGSAVGFGGDTASFLARLQQARTAALAVGATGLLSLIASRLRSAQI
jgi:hypothetical protein